MPIIVPLTHAKDIDTQRKDYAMLSEKGYDDTAKAMATGIIKGDEGKLEYLYRGVRSDDPIKLPLGVLTSVTDLTHTPAGLTSSYVQASPLLTASSNYGLQGATNPALSLVSVPGKVDADVLNHESQHAVDSSTNSAAINKLASSYSRIKSNINNDYSAYTSTPWERRAAVSELGSFNRGYSDRDMDQATRYAAQNLYYDGGQLPPTQDDVRRIGFLYSNQVLRDVDARRQNTGHTSK